MHIYLQVLEYAPSHTGETSSMPQPVQYFVELWDIGELIWFSSCPGQLLVYASCDHIVGTGWLQDWGLPGLVRSGDGPVAWSLDYTCLTK